MANITKTLTLKLDGGDRIFPIKDLDFFNIVCELEDSGIDVMSLTSGSLERTKIFSTMRALTAVLVNVQKDEAGALISEHIRNGGTLDVIMEAFTEAMADAGFGETPEEEEKPKRGRKTSK